MTPDEFKKHWFESGEIVPLNDLRQHIHDGSKPCWCNPVDEDGVIVHNSADGREKFEEGYVGIDKRRLS